LATSSWVTVGPAGAEAPASAAAGAAGASAEAAGAAAAGADAEAEALSDWALANRAVDMRTAAMSAERPVDIRVVKDMLPPDFLMVLLEKS
jgi:hypothetical protein